MERPCSRWYLDAHRRTKTQWLHGCDPRDSGLRVLSAIVSKNDLSTRLAPQSARWLATTVSSMGRVESVPHGTTPRWNRSSRSSGSNVLCRRRQTPFDEVSVAILMLWIERTYHRCRRQRAVGRLTPIHEGSCLPTCRPAREEQRQMHVPRHQSYCSCISKQTGLTRACSSSVS